LPACESKAKLLASGCQISGDRGAAPTQPVVGVFAALAFVPNKVFLLWPQRLLRNDHGFHDFDNAPIPRRRKNAIALVDRDFECYRLITTVTLDFAIFWLSVSTHSEKPESRSHTQATSSARLWGRSAIRLTGLGTRILATRHIEGRSIPAFHGS
jgi:hypothetical protein